ncbi:MAG: 4-hydroxy-tetrahydrodipicolinate synthase [Clostridiales bacterium]|nr:4-hydroxy-tetrahydrodipicolinate synthase [Clostridiales bacterium]
MSIFSGTGVALATPASDDEILFSEVEKLISYVVSGGADALIALGTTGEASTLSDNQKESFVRFVRTKTDLPLIVGTGGNNTKAVTKNCLSAEKWGADAFLVVTPFYNKCTQEGAFAHYKYIAERVSHPIIVYNVPGRTGFNLLPETMAKIAKLKNVVGIKEASGNMVQIERCLSIVEADIYSGDDALTAPAMCMGAKGVISVAANVAPELVSHMTNMALSGNLLKAGAMQLKLLPLIDALFAEVNPIPVRAALNMLGIDMGNPRLPMTELSESNKAMLKSIMEELKLI